ncbi:hypothetical protein F4804DRAFT_345812 [Jackrogersella minutella]|nr:hypothetical protein F4804DRAFT_345812 [Jackrogersella minutella]
MPLSSLFPNSYTRVSDDEPFLDHQPQKNEIPERSSYHSNDKFMSTQNIKRRWYMKSRVPWAISLILLIISLLLLVRLTTVQQLCTPSPLGSFERGWETDLDAAKPHIQAKLIKFTGSPEFYENGTLYRSYPKDQPQYVGEPSPEIDKAWNMLLYGSVVDLSPELAGKMNSITWKELDGELYRTGLDVFHQLHCLDYIRKALYPDYYPQEDITRLFMMHVEHCIDYIRQALMCAADSTPVRLQWRKESHHLIPKFDMYHTCRNFEMLKDFSNQHALELYNDENQRLINEKYAQGVL